MRKDVKVSGFQSLSELSKSLEFYSVLSWFWLLRTRYVDNINSSSLVLMSTNYKGESFDKTIGKFNNAVTEFCGHSDWINSLAPFLFEALVLKRPDLQKEEISASLKELDSFNKAIVKLLRMARTLPENSATSRLVKTKRLSQWVNGRLKEVCDDASLSLREVIKNEKLDVKVMSEWLSVGYYPYDYTFFPPKPLRDIRNAVESLELSRKDKKQQHLNHIVSSIYNFSQMLAFQNSSKLKIRGFYKSLLSDGDLGLALYEADKRGMSKRIFGKVFVMFIVKIFLGEEINLEQIESILKIESKRRGLKNKTMQHRHKHIIKKLDAFHQDIYKNVSYTNPTDMSFAFEAFYEWALRSGSLSLAIVSKYRIQKKDYDLIKQKRDQQYRRVSKISNRNTSSTINLPTTSFVPNISSPLTDNELSSKPPLIVENVKAFDLFFPLEDESL